MACEGRGDDVYQPDSSDVGNRPTDDLDLENVLDERGLDDTMEEGYSPPERPLGVSKYGTTDNEQRAGESLEQRLAQEEPESNGPGGDEAGDERAGRIAAEEEAVHPTGDGTEG